jgi:hypothetical protein
MAMVCIETIALLVPYLETLQGVETAALVSASSIRYPINHTSLHDCFKYVTDPAFAPTDGSSHGLLHPTLFFLPSYLSLLSSILPSS